MLERGLLQLRLCQRNRPRPDFPINASDHVDQIAPSSRSTLPHLAHLDPLDADLAGIDDLHGRPELQARAGRPHRLGVDVGRAVLPSCAGAVRG